MTNKTATKEKRAVYPRTFRLTVHRDVAYQPEFIVTAYVNGSIFMGEAWTGWGAFFGCLEQWQRWATQTGRISQ